MTNYTDSNLANGSSEITSEQLIQDPIGRYPSATVACFDATMGDLPRRQLDQMRHRRFLEMLGRLGAPAVLIAASTGHGHLRTVDELRQWFRCAASANLRRTVRMALLRPEDGDDTNRSLVAELRDLNYPVIFVRPGNNLPADATAAAVADNMRPVVVAAAQAGLAVGIYSIPDVSGVRLTAEAAANLVQGAGGDRIVAAKITEADYDLSTLTFLEHPALRHLKIVQGWDPHLARALRDGTNYDAQGRQRCGITSGPMSLAIYQYLHLLRAAEQGDWNEVATAQAAVTALFASMQDDPRKFADLHRAKYIMGMGQPIMGSVSDEQVERVLHALATLPRFSDRFRLARSLDLLADGPYHARLAEFAMADAHIPLADLRELVRTFVDERQWKQFHSPKNLSMGLAVETAELMEHFQWITTEESRAIATGSDTWRGIREELADVFCYALCLANELDIDLTAALHDKMMLNVAKYPAVEYQGRYRQ